MGVAADDPGERQVAAEEVLAGLAQCLVGFAAGLNVEHSELPVDVQEIIKDFVSLTSLDPEDYQEADFEPGELEEHEASLTEVHEYLRVSTMLILALMDDHAAVESAID